jgi:hypothetical protein
MATFPKDEPEVCIVERVDGSEFQLEDVALTRVHVWLGSEPFLGVDISRLTDGMDALAASCESIVEDIIACTCDGQNVVVLVDT